MQHLSAVSFLRLTTFVGIPFLLAACGPLDKPLRTEGTLDDYKATLDPIIAEMPEREVAAFNWAVSDFNLERLHAEYPGASPRKIIRGEVKKVLETYPARIALHDADAAKVEPILEEIAKIRATETRFFITESFHGLQPKVEATLVNGSSLEVSQLSWNASLYLDDAMTPVATSILKNDYRDDGGMKPGSTWTVNFTIGFVKGDENWTTLQVRNATRTRVELAPIVTSVRDYANQAFVPVDHYAAARALANTLETAKSFEDI